MVKNYVVYRVVATLALLVGVAATSNAQYLSSRTVKSTSPEGFALQRGTMLRADYAEGCKVDIEQYGTPVTISKETFDKMSSGSETNPDTNTDIKKVHPDYPVWFTIDPQYTTTHTENSWMGARTISPEGIICPAGGMIYLKDKQVGINTALVDVSGHEGVAIFRFKMRLKEPLKEGQTLRNVVHAKETNNMGPTWTDLGYQVIPDGSISTEWQTYEFLFSNNCGKTSFFFVELGSDEEIEVLIDDVEVLQIDTEVKRPKILPYTDYNRTSFTLNWEASAGATSYLVSVFKELPSMGQLVSQKEYLIQDKSTTEASYKVEGIEDGETYYYTIQAVKAGTPEKKSYKTIPEHVVEIGSPTINKPTLDGLSYKATWTEVPTADVYNYTGLQVRRVGQDGPFHITNETFDGVKDPDGNYSNLTKENPGDRVYPDQNITELKQGGWIGYSYRAYTDYICLDAWHWLHNREMAGLISPVLDLSGDGGKVTVKVRLAATLNKWENAQGEKVESYTQAGIALFNYNEATGQFEQTTSDPYYIREVTDEWKEFTVEITGGSKKSQIGIFALLSPGNLYVDDLEIIQNRKSGDELIDPFIYRRFVKDHELDVEVPEASATRKLMHEVTALKTVTVSQDARARGTILKVESKPSNREVIQEGSATSSKPVALQEEGITYRLEGKTLFIHNPSALALSVYTLAGERVYAGEAGQEHLVVELDYAGSYLVATALEQVKVLVH